MGNSPSNPPSDPSPAPLLDVPSDTAFAATLHPAECRVCIDNVLATLAKRHGAAVVDPLLDLKLDIQRRRDPGGCVQRYFEVLGRLAQSGQNDAEIAQMRAWLESLIEIKATTRRKAKTAETWRLPLYLAGAKNLDAYCDCVIGDVRDMYAGQPCEIELYFSYRAAA